MGEDDIKVVGSGEEQDEQILGMLDQAERDAAAEGAQVRVNFRWGAGQLERVKEAARLQGLPYQI